MTNLNISRRRRSGRSGRLAAVLGVVSLVALCVAGCGGSGASHGGGTSASSLPGKGKPAVTIGDKEFTEEYILGDLYAQALRAKGYTVNLKQSIGSTTVIDAALRSGQIDMYPEYTGTILQILAHQARLEPSAEATYQAAKVYEQRRGFTLLGMTPFYDADAVGVLNSYAHKHDLKAIGDLRRLGSAVTYAEYPQNIDSLEGFTGLQRFYGLKQMQVKSIAIGLQYPALQQGAVQAADVFTTDPQLAAGGYTLLADTKHIFGFQNVAPVVSPRIIAREGPAFAQTINDVSRLLTLSAVRSMDAAATIDKHSPTAIAAAFLKANGMS